MNVLEILLTIKLVSKIWLDLLEIVEIFSRHLYPDLEYVESDKRSNNSIYLYQFEDNKIICLCLCVIMLNSNSFLVSEQVLA